MTNQMNWNKMLKKKINKQQLHNQKFKVSKLSKEEWVSNKHKEILKQNLKQQ